MEELFLIPLIAAGLSTGLAIKNAVSKPDVPTIPTAAQSDATMKTESDKAAEATKARARAAGAGGRASTILTSPLGVTGSSPVSTGPKTLLGE